MSRRAEREKKRLDKLAANAAAIEEYNGYTEKWDLDWFKPNEYQAEIFECLDDEDVDIVLVNAPAGCGKSSAAIWKALTDIRNSKFKNLTFLKTPAEYGDDQIGFLTGDKNQKLDNHFEVMRGIFYDFMPKTKLTTDEKKGTIKFTIPNFLAGATLYNTILIVDEAQTLSEETLKLVLERLGEGSKAIVLYDHKQQYTVKHRSNGAKYLESLVVHRDLATGEVTEVEEFFEYVEIPSEMNMRSRVSRKITELYARGS